MLRKTKPIPAALLVAALICLGAPDLAAANGTRYLVRLAAPSLVELSRDASAPLPRASGGRLDLRSRPAREHLRRLAEDRALFEARLREKAPAAAAERHFSILLNGLVVHGADPEDLREIPGVISVSLADTTYYEPSLDASLDLIDASHFWAVLGGPQSAGAGIKVAVIDSGIDISNPFFDASGYAMPAGYPLGEAEFTTAKVIAARAYFRSWDPVDPDKDTEDPIDHGGHGSHCAGIIAGNAGTVFDLTGTPVEVSGVAPGAYLMNYKVFYNAASGQDGAYDTELMAAFEDAVADGADVISCSWGGPAPMVDETPAGQLYQAAVEAGAVVVFAAGNDGSGPATVGHPGILPGVLTVGSVSTGRAFAGYVDVEGPGTVPADLRGVMAIKGSISPTFEGSPLGPLPLVSARAAGQGANNDGCAAFPWGAFDGAVALIERGNCLFTEKIDHAFLAGALAVVVYNNIDGAAAITMGGDAVPIPAMQVGQEDGIALEKWAAEHDDASISLHDTMSAFLAPQDAEAVAGSSARGPTDTLLLKPEIAAPGVGILSADAHWPGALGQPWGLKSGTSMATPHVAGAAALVRQRHPGLDAGSVQSLLVQSARRDFLTADTTTANDVGAGILDLKAASAAGAWVVPPSLSLGAGPPGTVFTATLALHDAYWTAADPVVAWEHETSDPPVTLSPPEGEHVDLGADQLTVAIGSSAGSSLGEHTGRLVLRAGQEEVVVPYHFRVVPPQTEALLLLDMSFLDEGQTFLVDFYSNLAAFTGVEAEVLRVLRDGEAPALAELLPYRTVLAFTGNDQVYHEGSTGWRTLDVLSSFAAAGGNLIVAGQGPLRGNEHTRVHGFLGARIDDTFPLFDPYTQDLVSLPSYLVRPPLETEGIAFTALPLDIGPDAGGAGDLVMVGELTAVLGGGLPDLWVEPFLIMEADPFSDGAGVLGMAFDPYEGYGAFPEVEVLRGRSAIMGVGFERLGQATAGVTSSAAELFAGLHDWVSERIEVSVAVETAGLDVTAFIEAVPVAGASYEVDFGDGAAPLAVSYEEVFHHYEAPGQYRITVVARAPLGAADVARTTIEVAEEIPGQPDGGADTDPAQPAGNDWGVPEERVRDCGCTAVGGGGGGGSLLLLFLFPLFAFLLRLP